jgi:hypothetical protein
VSKNITIGELKERIAAQLPSHPAPQRQRLIYLGRNLQPDTENLAHYFGDSVVRVFLHFSLNQDARPSIDQVRWWN